MSYGYHDRSTYRIPTYRKVRSPQHRMHFGYLAATLAILALLAGYLLRGWLAVLWERKRQQQQDTGLTSRLAKSMPEIFTGPND